MSDVIDFSSGNFVHLGLGAATLPLPTHTGDMEWYAEYEQAHGDDGFEGRLVSMHTFTESWDTSEVHPTVVNWCSASMGRRRSRRRRATGRSARRPSRPIKQWPTAQA